MKWHTYKFYKFISWKTADIKITFCFFISLWGYHKGYHLVWNDWKLILFYFFSITGRPWKLKFSDKMVHHPSLATSKFSEGQFPGLLDPLVFLVWGALVCSYAAIEPTCRRCWNIKLKNSGSCWNVPPEMFHSVCAETRMMLSSQSLMHCRRCTYGTSG